MGNISFLLIFLKSHTCPLAHTHTHIHQCMYLVGMLILRKLGCILPIWLIFFCTVKSYFVVTEKLALTESMLAHRK